MIAWLIEPGPFEVAMRKYLNENPRIPEPFIPSSYLDESHFCRAQIDIDTSNEDDYFYLSPRIHMVFCSIFESLIRLACTNRKRWRRSDNFQSLRSFLAPFLICAPYRPWNEYGGDIGAALSPQSLRAVMRYRGMFDPEEYRPDYEARKDLEPWGAPHSLASEFEDYERFVQYIDRIADRATEAIEVQRALLVAVY